MQWDSVPKLWQSCFELAWDAHLQGSNPIAALIADSKGEVIATGKSAVKASLADETSSNCEIAHAEINALLKLDNRIHKKQKTSDYTLYVTLEPCPLCFSALYMSDINKLAYAAPDRFGGSTNILKTTPYLSRKPTEIKGPVDHLDRLSIFMNVYCDVLRGSSLPNVVHDEFAKDYPKVVQAAQSSGANDSLEILRQERFLDVYAKITGKLLSLS